MKKKASGKTGGAGTTLFLQQKLNNPAGYLLMLIFAGLFGLLYAKNLLYGLGFTGIFLSLALCLVCLLSTEAGLYINIIYSFFISFFSRLFFQDIFPVGVITDVLILATLFSIFIKNENVKQDFRAFSKTRVITWILILFIYITIEFFNPYAHSFDGWYQTFRKMLEAVLIIFISFSVFKDTRRIENFLKALLLLSTLTAIYGCIQQWHGLFEFEKSWVMADQTRFDLIFINGEFRKFSTMSDPTAFGIIMSSCAVLFTVIGIEQKKFTAKLVLFSCVILMLLAMSYSGTRTANAMVVAGLAMFILLTFNRKSTKLFTLLAGAVFLVLLYGPFYGNSTINRFRTTFKGSNDMSYEVRNMNRKFIQPYIYRHPIGGGLGTTGIMGLKYNPGHYLAGFPPDSGYLKTALETGWIGLAILCFLYFVVLKSGIRGFFAPANKKENFVFAACTSSIFSFYIADYAQDAIGQLTDLVVYYPMIAIILKLNYLNHTQKITKHE